MPTSALKVPPQTRSSQALNGGIRSAERMQPINNQSCIQLFSVTRVPLPTMDPTGLFEFPEIVNERERLFSKREVIQGLRTIEPKCLYHSIKET